MRREAVEDNIARSERRGGSRGEMGEKNAEEHHVLKDRLNESTAPNGQVIKCIDSKAR